MPGNKQLKVDNLLHGHSIGNVDLWQTYSFAPEWLNDALNEAKSDGVNYRRREILFAVAFAESYLVEWVRDDLLKRDYTKFKDYFPFGKKVNAVEKWKEIPKKLAADNHIKRTPDLKQPFWCNWTTLVKYRDGLVHAVASRPERTSLPPEGRPVPPTSHLEPLKPGWAVDIVIQLVEEFHNAAGTPIPEWIKKAGRP
jgi:hypothetical protein